MGTRLRVLPYDHATRGVTVDETHQDLFDYGRSRSGEDRAGGRRKPSTVVGISAGMEGGVAGVQLLVPDDRVEGALIVLKDA